MGEKDSVLVGGKRVDFAALTIEGEDGPVSIEPKVMALLQLLVANAGTVVSRQDILDTVWHENYGGDESLSRGVSFLRRAFGENRNNREYIETVPKRGYRLVAQVTAGHESSRSRLKYTAALAVTLLVAAAFLALFLKEGETQVTTAAPKPNSIAVLPFLDLSATQDQQYLSEGLAEEILNALLKLPGLQVIGRQSSFVFGSSQPELAEIRETLAVSYALTGSLRRQDNQVRVTARLLETETGHTLWSDNYDRALDNIFELQEEIAREIASNLGVVMDLTDTTAFPVRLTNNREAYDLFLQGRMLTRKFGHRNKLKASELLGRAVELDPRFASAWAWLAQAHIYLTLSVSEAELSAQIAAARAAVNEALKHNPDLAMAHYTRSILLDYDLDFAASLDAHEKAHQLNPNDPLLAHRRGYAHQVVGQNKKGAKLMREALRLDPTDAVGLLNLGVAQRSAGLIDEANQSFQRSKDLGFVPGMIQPCISMAVEDKWEAATACWNQLPSTFRHRYQPLLNRGITWEELGTAHYGYNQAIKARTLEALDSYLSEPSAHANSYLLHTYLWIGEPERFMQMFVRKRYPLNAGAISGIWEDLEGGRDLRQHH